MAKTRVINTRFWSDNYIVSLDPLERYLFLYFLSNEHTNICGIYELPLRRMSSETGIEEEMLRVMMRKMSSRVAYIDGWIGIKNFGKHQAKSESIRIGIEKALSEIDPKILNKIQKHWTPTPHQPPTNPPLTELSESESESESKKESKSKRKGKALTSNALALNEVNQSLECWKELNPNYTSFYANKTQRQAQQWLLVNWGIERLKNGIEILKKTNSMPYMPKILSPYELKRDYAKLKYAIQQEQNKRSEKGIKNKIAFI